MLQNLPLHPPDARPGVGYLNGFDGGGVFGFTLAGNCLSVLYGFASNVGCGALIVLNEPPRILSLASFAFCSEIFLRKNTQCQNTLLTVLNT